MSASELIENFRRRHGLRTAKKQRTHPRHRSRSAERCARHRFRTPTGQSACPRSRSKSEGTGRQRQRPVSAPPGGPSPGGQEQQEDAPMPNTLSSSHPLLRFRAVARAHLRADEANVVRAPKQWRARACKESAVMKLGDTLISKEELAELLEKEVHPEDASTDAGKIFDMLDVQNLGSLPMSLILGGARQGKPFDVEVEVLHCTMGFLLHGECKGKYREPGTIAITIGQCHSGLLLQGLLREIDTTLGVSSNKYYVVFQGRALKSPYATLGEYGIEGPFARVSIMPRISKGMDFMIFVSWRSQTIEVHDCNSEQTLGWLRAHLQILCKVPRDKQSLRIGERLLCAADKTTFDDYDMLPFTQITLERRKESFVVSRGTLGHDEARENTIVDEAREGTILLHMLDGRLFELTIRPGDKVAWLKKKVFNASGIAEKDQLVCVFGQPFQDKDAIDYLALEDVGIHRNSHVWILARGPLAMLVWQSICTQLTCS